MVQKYLLSVYTFFSKHSYHMYNFILYLLAVGLRLRKWPYPLLCIHWQMHNMNPVIINTIIYSLLLPRHSSRYSLNTAHLRSHPSSTARSLRRQTLTSSETSWQTPTTATPGCATRRETTTSLSRAWLGSNRSGRTLAMSSCHGSPRLMLSSQMWWGNPSPRSQRTYTLRWRRSRYASLLVMEFICSVS